ncbi:MAG: TonB-dependent receptor, partial [Pseudomonadota bacterium]
FYQGVSNIPTNIIERVEVLKDGSSALYGSDAMAGVMNFITRKDYDGAEFSTRVNVPEINQGLQQNHSLAFGQSFNRGNWFASAQYVEQRGYTELDVGNAHRFQTRPFGPSGRVDYYQNAEDTRPERVFSQSDCEREDGRRCLEDTRGQDFIRDPRTNLGTLLSGRYEINSDISVSVLGIYNRRNRRDIGRAFDINAGIDEGDPRLSTANIGSPDFKAASVSQGELFAFNYRPGTDSVGGREVNILQDSYSAQAKVEGYFLDTWKWDVSGSYAASNEKRDHVSGLYSVNSIRQSVANGTFAPNDLSGRNAQALADAQVNGIEGYEASMSQARLLATGELFDMNDVYGAGGPVSIALGAEGQWETTRDNIDTLLFNQPLNQVFLPNIAGSRNVGSVFSEIVLYPLESVEVQLAGRYDNYSDFGDTFNPKVSVGFRPSKKMLLRSSWGTNFNAPSVRNMIARSEVLEGTYRFCTPEQNANGTCVESRNVRTVRYRDPDLKEEVGMNYNFGTVIQPNKAWTFTMDQWNFEGEDILGRVGNGIYSDLHDAIGREGLASVGATYETDDEGNVISARLPLVTNRGERTIRGLDLGVNFRNPIRLLGRVLNFSANFDHTHMLVYETTENDFSPTRNRNDLEWKNTIATSLSTKRHSYRIAARTLAGDTGFATTRTHTEYDLNYNYRIPFFAASFSFGVKNLLNTRPPVDRSRDLIDFSSGFNAYAFQALGRRYYVGYSQSF